MNVLVLFSLISALNYSVNVNNAPMLDSSRVESFLKVPVVITVTDFNEYAAEKFSSDVQEALDSGEPIIPIIIDSYGGSVYALLRMVDTIKSVKVPVATIVLGKAMSAGAIWAAMGTDGYRFAAPNSTILIHDVSSWAQGKVPSMKNDVEEAERLNKLIFVLLAEQCHKPKNYFLNILNKKGHLDLYMTPQSAKKMNIVNHIKLPTIKIQIKTEMVLE